MRPKNGLWFDPITSLTLCTLGVPGKSRCGEAKSASNVELVLIKPTPRTGERKERVREKNGRWRKLKKKKKKREGTAEGKGKYSSLEWKESETPVVVAAIDFVFPGSGPMYFLLYNPRPGWIQMDSSNVRTTKQRAALLFYHAALRRGPSVSTNSRPNSPFSGLRSVCIAPRKP